MSHILWAILYGIYFQYEIKALFNKARPRTLRMIPILTMKALRKIQVRSQKLWAKRGHRSLMFAKDSQDEQCHLVVGSD